MIERRLRLIHYCSLMWVTIQRTLLLIDSEDVTKVVDVVSFVFVVVDDIVVGRTVVLLWRPDW